jgi:hypothetical protein
MLMTAAIAFYCAFSAITVESEAGFDGAVSIVSEEGDKRFAVYLAKVPYRDVYGEPAEGQARLVFRRDAEGALPPFCHVHYEKPVEGARTWAKDGWAVFSPVYSAPDGEYPIDASVGNGNNLARAIILWARRLPFIDRPHLHIDGGSQGGYMALAMSAAFFPVQSTTADMPVINWAYNLNYFAKNHFPDEQDHPLFVVDQVRMLGPWSYAYFGEDLSAEAWYRVSPISYLDLITNPVLVTAATGDMLVPMEQMTSEHVPEHDAAEFPAGFTRDFDTLAPTEQTRQRLADALGDRLHVEVMPLQEHAFELTPEIFADPAKKPKERPANQDKPWSKKHQWNLVILDEGPPAAYSPHTRYEWAVSSEEFVQHHRDTPPPVDLLTPAKLAHLMQRFTHQIENAPLLKNGEPVNRLQSPRVETHDVLQGLIDHATVSSKHLDHLQATYTSGDLRPLGEPLTLERLEEALARVDAGEGLSETPEETIIDPLILDPANPLEPAKEDTDEIIVPDAIP